jgi:hypothetical protein
LKYTLSLKAIKNSKLKQPLFVGTAGFIAINYWFWYHNHVEKKLITSTSTTQQTPNHNPNQKQTLKNNQKKS